MARNPSSKTGLSIEYGLRSGGEDFFRLVSRFIRLTPLVFASFSFSLGWTGGVPAASAPAIATFGGGLMSVVARGERAGAGAGVVASRATTAAGTDAELDVLPAKGL